MTDMNIQIDFRSGQPIYLQIVEQVSKMVATGELQQGDQLPTVRQLATELRVNFNTVARAYRLLDETGLISTQQGRGTYIWEAPSEETLVRLRQDERKGARTALLTTEGFRDVLPVLFDFLGVSDPAAPPPRRSPRRGSVSCSGSRAGSSSGRPPSGPPYC